MLVTRRMLLAGIGLSVAAPGLGGCSRSLPTYRYRLTVEVDTPQGPRSGSSVIEVRTVDQAAFPGPEAGGIRHSIRGEVVAVDVAPGKTLFALLRSVDTVDWPNNVMFILSPPVPGVEEDDIFRRRFDQMLANRKPIILPRQYAGPEFRIRPLSAYPQLVHFRDIRDPKTVEAVDPDNLAAAFGAGVQLKRIVVQITDDPVTTGIKRRFPWWNTYKDRHFDGSNTISEDMITNILSAHLSSGSFSTEFNK